MHCPFCGATETKVIDSRLVAEGNQIRRRRQCLTCDERFTTYETAELVMPKVVKQDGTRDPFDENKLRSGIQRALEKRPVSMEQIEGMIERICFQLRASGEREVDSQLIGEKVMEALRDVDQVAFVRFASVYRSFQDVSEFRDAIDHLQKKKD